MVEGCDVPPAQSTVRSGTKRDALGVATLHVGTIDEGFLSTLGAPFLRRLYGRLAATEHGFLLVADDVTADGSALVGFVAGATSLRALYREFLWRDGLAAACRSIPNLARSLPKVWETLRYGTAPPSDDGAPPEDEVELLSIGVASSARGRGTGGALVEAFFGAAARTGAQSARVVVGSENHAAIRMYQRAGFVVARQLELHAGNRSLLMRTALPALRQG
jgi:ribosomal protein S18 acetylase RimI-like enzyme